MKIILALVGLLVLAGCDRKPAQPEPPKSAFKLPEGLPEDRHIRITQETHSGGSTERAAGQGAGLTATGDKASAKDIDTSAPDSRLSGGVGSTGGGFSGDLSAAVGGENRWLIGGVVLALLGAGFCTFRALRDPLNAGKWFRGAVVCGGVAAACLACVVAPGLVIVVGAGGAVLMVGLYLWELRGHAKFKTEATAQTDANAMLADQTDTLTGTLKTIKTTIDKAPDVVRAELLPRLSAAMDRTHKDVIKSL